METLFESDGHDDVTRGIDMAQAWSDEHARTDVGRPVYLPPDLVQLNVGGGLVGMDGFTDPNRIFGLTAAARRARIGHNVGPIAVEKIHEVPPTVL